MAISAAGFFFFIAVAALPPSSRHRRCLTAVVSSPLSRRRRLAAIAAVIAAVNVASYQLEIILLGNSRLPVGRLWPTVTPPPLEVGKCRTYIAQSYCCCRLGG